MNLRPGWSGAIDRRDFLLAGLRIGSSLSAAALAGCADDSLSFGPSHSSRTAVLRSEGDLLAGDALAQAARIRSGAATSRELVDATIARIEALNGPLNAVVTTFFARAQAYSEEPLPDGPFRGVPFLLKDLNDLEGTPKSMGSRLFGNYVSSSSSPHTEAALEGGFVILGKTNTPEFGLVPTTESAALGPCRNPWNLSHSSGGSSGGAAAAVASGMVPIAQASDGGGSIRVPASCCGVFGLKPSRGRNRAAPQTRAVDISVKHCVSRTVRDTAAYSMVVQRRDQAAPFAPAPYVEGPSKRRLRIGFFTQNPYGQESEPDVKEALEATARLCEDLGHEIITVKLDFEGEAFVEHFLNLWSSIPAGILERVENQGIDPTEVLEPVTLGMAERFRRQPAGVVGRAAHFMKGYAQRVDGYFRSARLEPGDDARFDMLLSPVLRRSPIKLGEMAGTLPFEDVFGPMVDYASFTPIWNATGHPAMSVPLAWNQAGLPIGSQFIAGLGEEEALLALAYELEAARPWADRLPPS